MDSKTEQLRARTKEFAIRIVRLFRSVPQAKEAQVIGNQLLRCGTSVGANYRAACQARSKAEFIAKIGIVAEEADETVFWIELLSENYEERTSRTVTQGGTRVDRYFFCVTTDGKAKIAIGLQIDTSGNLGNFGNS